MTAFSSVRTLGRVAVFALLVIPAACAQTKVTRIDPNAVTDLSGGWNDTDSRLVANELIQSSLSEPWLRRHTETHGGQAPVVIIGSFFNNTMEHIPVATFTKDLEKAYVTSGTVRVIATKDERSDVRNERKDQRENARADTRARQAQELGAKYMLQGSIETLQDAQGREKVVYYQINATLVDLESNEKVWTG
ncbi:MAG: penicillin-binding protein activator LpoB, partial [Longimicrobiales bacterium]